MQCQSSLILLHKMAFQPFWLDLTVFNERKYFAVPRHAVGGLLENQYPVFCGGSNVGWDDANGYEQGCYKMGDSVPFQVFFWQNFISQLVISHSYPLRYLTQEK